MDKFKSFVLDLLFPRFCLSCRKEGAYLCDDCFALLDVSQHQYCLCQKPKRTAKCPDCFHKSLDGLYSAVPYQNKLIQLLIGKFKDTPFVKDMGQTLSAVIANHFQLLDKPPDFTGFTVVPVPLDKKRLHWRGFNQAEEIAKELAPALSLPLNKNILGKNKDGFICNGQPPVKVLLIDDTYVTGATLEKASLTLKTAGTEQVFAAVVARGTLKQ